MANIPEGCRPWDLTEALKRFGDLVEYIWRFGFTSFKGVRDWKEMEDSIKNMKMGSWTLKINKGWYANENGVSGPGFGGTKLPSAPTVKPPFAKVQPRSSEFKGASGVSGASFRDTVKGVGVGERKETEVHIDDSYNGVSLFAKRALVATCCNFDSLCVLVVLVI